MTQIITEQALSSAKMEDFESAVCRIDCILHVASAVACDAISDEFEEFAEWVLDDDTRLRKSLCDALPEWETVFRDIDEYDVDARELPGIMLDCGIAAGYIFKLTTPTPEWRRDGGGASFSWGYCHFTWLYAETLEEGEQACLAYAKALWESRKSKGSAA